MKHFYTLVLSVLICQTYAQVPVWNKQLPMTTTYGGLDISIQTDEDEYLVGGSKNIFALNQLGEVTRAVLNNLDPATNGFGSFLRKKIDPQTGEKYFLVATIKFPSPNVLAISEYRPGQGFVHETVLDEMYGSTAFSPVFVDLNDSTYIILGRKYIRQITHRPGQGVIVNWEKPNTLGNPNAGIKTSQGTVGVGQNGVVFALDNEGNTLWADTTAYILRDIQMTDNQGFLATGRTVDSTAVIVKFTSNGSIEWTREYNDLVYNGLLIEGNESLTVTGQSDSLQVVLCHLAPDGTILWRNTYQPGAGRALLKVEDGYIVVGRAGPTFSTFALRTNIMGNSSSMDNSVHPKKRTVQNGLLSVIAAPSPNLFFDNIFFDAPKDTLTSVFYTAAPWFGALDQDSTLHLAAETYANEERSDYRTGISKGSAADFDRVWWVSKEQIEDLRQDWAENGQLDRPIPYDISTWPAKGNTQFNYNLDFTQTTTDKSLLPAPFIDANGDGIYNPADGDYPRIKGDQMAWWILTDSTFHGRSNGDPLAIDIGISMYVYDCQQDIQLSRSLMVDFEVINRSGNSYSQMFAGIWVDQDLGCFYDDYIGSLPATNTMYVYTQDTLDGQGGISCGNTSIFGNNVPVGSLSFVNTSLDKFIYYNNGSVNPAPPLGTDDPAQDTEYYNYIRAKWRDGTVPTYNGQPIDLLFPDNPADPLGNSMCTSNLPPSDRRFIGSHGPFDLAPNDTFLLSAAFTYHPNIPLPCPDIFGTVKNDLEQLHTLLNSGALEAPSNLPSNVRLTPGQSLLLDATVAGAIAYVWSTGATTATIEVTQVGEYSVTITRGTGCATVETVLVTATARTPELDGFTKLRLFPNPSAGQFKVEVSGTAQENLEFLLYNSLGQLVQRQMTDFRSGTLNQTFDCTRLPSGIYTLCLKAGGKMRYGKVVVQH